MESDYWTMVYTNEEESKTFEGKAPKTIEQVLLGVRKYMEDKKSYVRLLAEATRRYRLSQTMRGKLKTPLLNGRMHTAYDVTGTDTGLDKPDKKTFPKPITFI